MNFIMPCIQLFCCNRVPNSTKTDYYLDPKIMTKGEPIFKPKKVQNKITEDEFLEMRKEMIEAGGEDLKRAITIYKILTIYAITCFMTWVVLTIFEIIDRENAEKYDVPMVVGILTTAVPNIVLQCKWKSAMKKSCKNITEMFEQKNLTVYLRRNIQWLMKNTLVYVQIKLIDPEDQQQPDADGKTGQSFSSQKSEKKAVVEVDEKRESLLKSYFKK